MIRYRMWSLAATLLLASLSLVACTGSPSGSNANGAGPKAGDAAQNGNGAKPGPAPAATATGYEGFQDDINCYNVIGWAWDGQRPNEPVKVEILDGTTLLATVTADLFRQDLADARKGNGMHSFNYSLPPQMRDGKPHTIRTRIAGTDMDLAHTLKEITCKPE
ncbi:MAG TPA: hypothetical protein VJZ91_02895 [Blastocatellia bacterium]|nr:hypothetical protein [Blastocatellia bacterium]